ncbi:Thsd7a [Symbiodinium sp. CCMP2592]|nr:Thsd7a [Symbiodinium sp. CCMP2592]
MRAEKTQAASFTADFQQQSVEHSLEESVEEKTETVPFDDVLFNVTVTQPPFAQSSESSQHAGEQQVVRLESVVLLLQELWSGMEESQKNCGVAAATRGP